MGIAAHLTAPLRRHRWLIGGFALYGAWALLAFATGLYFTGTESVVDACWFSVIAFALATGVLLAACIAQRIGLPKHPSDLGPAALFGASAALAALSLPCALLAGLGIPGLLGAGALAGASFGLFLATLAATFRRWKIKESLASAAWTFALGCLFTMFLCWAVDPKRMAVIAALLLGASFLCVRQGVRRDESIGRAAERSESPTAPPSPLQRPTARAALTGAVFNLFAGFFLSYVAVMTPRSLHFAGVLVAETLPGMSFAVLSTMVTVPVVLLALAAILSSDRPPFIGFALLVMVLLAAICLTVPSLSSFSMLHAAAVSPLAAVLVFIAWGLARAPEEPRGVSATAPGAITPSDVLLMAAATLAAIFALWFIAADEYANKALAGAVAIIPIALAIATVLLLLARRADIARELVPSLQFPERLDSSSLSNRCKMVSDAYGLTRREQEVLELYCEGRDVPYIENALSLSKSTVKTHTTHIYQKVGVSSKQELLDLIRQEKTPSSPAADSSHKAS